MKYIISGAYYNWIKGRRSQWYQSWAAWMYSRQLASGGHQQGRRNRAKRGVK